MILVLQKMILRSVSQQIVPLLKAVQHRKFHGDKFHVVYESMFVAFVQNMEVVGEEISFC